MNIEKVIKTEAEIILNIALKSEDDFEARYEIEDRLRILSNLISINNITARRDNDDDGEYTSTDNGEGDIEAKDVDEYTVKIIDDNVVIFPE